MPHSTQEAGGRRTNGRFQGIRTFLLLFAAIALLIILPLTLSFSLISLRYLRNSREAIAGSARLNVISAKKLTEMYQDTITQAATLVLMDPVLGDTAPLKRLEDVRGSYDTYARLSRAVSLLTSMTYIASLRITSVYFYVDGADYILTSDQGAVRLADFSDRGFQDVFQTLVRNPHSSVWTVRKVPLSPTSGDAVETADYLSYANMANPIVSKVRGAIFVNVRESVLSDLINAKDFDRDGNTFIIDADGSILSHVDKTRILTDIRDDPKTAHLFNARSGSATTASAGKDGPASLFVSAYSEKTSWSFISEHSLDALTGEARALMRKGILVTFIIVLIGSLIVIRIMSRISSPLKKLIGSLSQWDSDGADGGRMINEFEYLYRSFQRIREHEAVLSRTIDRSHDKLRESYFADLLRGDRDKYVEEPFPDSEIVPGGGAFRVITFSFDRRAEVESRLSQEQRFSYLALLCAECETAFPAANRCVAVRIDRNVSAILGAASEDGIAVKALSSVAARLQERFAPVLGSTLTAGISGSHRGDLSEVARAYDESLEAVTRRILAGYGKIHVWERRTDAGSRYPYQIETMLLNRLRAGDFPGAEQALGEFFSMLEELPSDDILHFVEQVCAALARFMKDNEIKRAGARGIFDELSGRETLEEMKAFLTDLCRTIAVETGSGSAILVERILDYVKDHFTEVIDFEAMSGQVGISYSYMRRLMRDRTGRSILEHQHYLRIEEAKSILSENGLSISAISKSLGYNNIQSFERFFKKCTGVSANEYRRHLSKDAEGGIAASPPRNQIRLPVSKHTVDSTGTRHQ